MRKRNIQNPPLDASLSLPDSLVTRCSALYLWDEEYALRAIEGYLQFMELKANFEDWDCEQLAPSVVIDLVWQQHLLYNKQYNQACDEYCGNLIGYDAEAILHANSPLQEQRIKTTKIALKALYGRSYDADVWNFIAASGMNKSPGKESHHSRPLSSIGEPRDSINARGYSKLPAAIKAPAMIANPRYNDSRQDADDSDGYNNRTGVGGSSSGSIRRDETISDSETSDMRLAILASKQLHQQEEANHSTNGDNRIASSRHKSNESVTVKIKAFIDGKTQDTCIRVKRTTKMKKVEDCLAKLMNLESAENLRFMIDGEQVSPWETLESMNVVDPEQHWFTVMPKVPNFQ
jgi:Ubiquitin-2 like Rad60 SUMO-like/Glycine-rich domain-containing protein-like